MEKELIKENHKKFSMRPMAMISLYFALFIIVVSFFLSLPFTHVSGKWDVSYIDALFTSVSATCVTGLVPFASGITGVFNTFGLVIIAILIQVGGLGAATIGVALFIIASRKLSFDQQSLIKDSWNISTFQGLKSIFGKIILITFTFETIGTLLLFLDFATMHAVPAELGTDLGVIFGKAVFTSISAYNNAGFDVFGNMSLIQYHGDVLLNFIIMFLVVFGGLGYLVVINIIRRRFKFSKFSFHTKVVLTMSIVLILFGTFAIFLSELSNHLGEASISGNTFLGSLFLSVSARTAGFTTYDLSLVTPSTLVILSILMFIGASPGGTGGGIKTTTFFVIFITVMGQITKRAPHGFNRAVSRKTVKKALLLFFLSITLVCFMFVVVSAFEYNLNRTSFDTYGGLGYLFECVSAFGTVGLSVGITPTLSVGSKIGLILLMYSGRLGPLSISQLLNMKEATWTYAEEDITIG